MAKSNPFLAPKNEFLDAFEREVKTALDCFFDTVWLGTHSPLAQPYFIGRTLEPGQMHETTQHMGQALQKLLRQAASQLPEMIPGTSTRSDVLLKKSCFERQPYATQAQIAADLNLSEKSYYRHRAVAVRMLAEALQRLVVPPLSTEQPGRPEMAGRLEDAQTVLQWLQAGQSVSLIGPSGIGKTTLASQLAHEHTSATGQPAFWFTLRPGLTDQLGTLIFSLAYFLKDVGADTTWKQLIADKGVIKRDVIPLLLRFDLEKLKQPALLCIDEISVLSVDKQEHQHIAELLEDLRKIVPVLLISQRPIIETDHQWSLSGLDLEATAQLLERLNLNIAKHHMVQLHETARGNPGLLRLFASLFHAGESIEHMLEGIGNSLSAELLFNRIWKRLNVGERHLLRYLSVFQNAFPRDAWQEHESTLARLLELALVYEHSPGHLSLPRHISTFAYEQAPMEMRPAFHLCAAEIYERRGEYTQAADHYISADHSSYAIWMWYAHRTQEIERGNGTIALQIMRRINPDGLAHARDKTTLALIRSTLHMLLNRPDLAEEELLNVAKPATPAENAVMKQLLGRTQEAQNRTQEAIEQFRQAIDLWMSDDKYRIVQLHAESSRLFAQSFGEMKPALQEALLARLTAEVYHGAVEERLGNYGEARHMYDTAVTIADKLEGHLQQKAFAYQYAGGLAWKQNRFHDAIKLLNKTIELKTLRGDSYAIAYDRTHLSAAYIMAEEYQMALHEVDLGLQTAQPLQHGVLISILLSNAAEAHYGLGNLERAEQLVDQSIRQEEPAYVHYALTVLGRVRRAQSRHRESIQHLKDAAKNALEVEDKYAEAAALRQLGETYLADRQRHLARESLTQALSLYEHMKLDKEIGEVHQLLASL